MPPTRRRASAHAAFLGSLAGILLAWDWVGAPKSITLEVDGAAAVVETRQTRVDGVLRETGLTADPGDALEPGRGTAVTDGAVVRLRRAVPVAVTYGGETRRFVTTAATVGEALAEAGLIPGDRDVVTLRGRRVAPGALLPRVGGALAPDLVSATPTKEGGIPPDEVAITLQPALTFYVHDGPSVLALHSTARTVGEALKDTGITLLASDLVAPDPGAALAHGQHILIRRATPFRLIADGQARELRTQATTVADALADAGLTMDPGDRVQPPPEAPLRPGTTVQVVRVAQRTIIEEQAIPYRTEYVPDASAEIGTQWTAQAGAPGLLTREYLVHYEDGREVRRELVSQTREREPVHAEVRYGTKVVAHSLATPDGPIQYWKTLRVWATWYSPANAGKPRSSPGYGITATGVPARRGVMAVDPSVIPLGTRVYVPGYGIAVAADTGGKVRGNIIDLAYGDDEVQDWVSRYVDIYFLGPGPDPSQVRPPGP